MRNGIGAATLKNNISVLVQYFNIYQWPVKVKSVKVNVPYCVKVKNIITISLLKSLIQVSNHPVFGYTMKALYLTAVFGFFRLATLVPNSVREFDVTRYPVVKDLAWAVPGLGFTKGLKFRQFFCLDKS